MGTGVLTRPANALMRLAVRLASGARLPSLYAATSPEAAGGQFVGPGPKTLTPSAKALDESGRPAAVGDLGGSPRAYDSR